MARTNRMTKCVLMMALITGILSAVPSSYSSTRPGRDANIANLLAAGLREHVKDRGRLPTSWQALSAYLRLDELEHEMGCSIDDAYSLETTNSTQHPARMLHGKSIVAIGKKTTRAPESYGVGRFVMVLRDSEHVSAVWVEEDAIQSILAGKGSDEESVSRARRLKIEAEITNTDGKIMPGEPLSVHIKASASRNEMPLTPELVFDVGCPDGRTSTVNVSDDLVVKRGSTSAINKCPLST